MRILISQKIENIFNKRNQRGSFTTFGVDKMENKKSFDYELLDVFAEFADAFADHLGLRVTKIIGAGRHGVAFLTNRLTVIKVTQNISEAIYASKLVKAKAPRNCIVYEVVSMGSLSGIHQELVKMCTFHDKVIYESIEGQLSGLSYLNAGGAATRKHLGALDSGSDKFRMLKQLCDAADELRLIGIEGLSLSLNKVGYSRSGYVLFGISDPADDCFKYKDELRVLSDRSPSLKVRRFT